MKNLKPSATAPAAENQEPCDPERLKVLEDAMREAIETYLTFTDPYNRMSRDEALGRLTTTVLALARPAQIEFRLARNVRFNVIYPISGRSSFGQFRPDPVTSALRRLR